MMTSHSGVRPGRREERLTDDSRFQIYKDGPGNVLASSRLAEEGIEAVVSSSEGLVGRHLSIRLYAVLQAVQLPASVANLDAGLTDVD